ncbi:MAG: alpha/beta hydrolase [Bdellovibrionales bacterium]
MWTLSLISSIYYAPLWLFSLSLTAFLILLNLDFLFWIPSLITFLSLSLVFIFKIKNSSLNFQEVSFRRLFFPQLLPVKPNSQLSCPLDGGTQIIDYFSPNGNTSREAIFFLFGGGFLNNDQSQLRLFNKRLAENGYHVFALNYRQLPQFPWPTPLNDILKMIPWTLNELSSSVSIKKFYIGGRSAGGCLAMMSSAEMNDSRHQGSFALYPVTDLSAWANEKYSNLTLKSRWRVNLLCQNNDSIAKKISPVNLQYSKEKKFCIITGDFDPLVDPSESEALQRVLNNQGCSSSLHILKNESHGCDASFDNLAGQKIEKLLVQFLQS